MDHHDEMGFSGSYDDRERSQTPPVFPYSTYPPPDELLLAPYGTTAAYPTLTTAESYPTYMAMNPVTLPPMTHFSDAIKREAYPDDGMNTYMSYGFVPGLDLNAPSPYDQSNPHVSYTRHIPPPRDGRR